jgi:hypothetical protein
MIKRTQLEVFKRYSFEEMKDNLQKFLTPEGAQDKKKKATISLLIKGSPKTIMLLRLPKKRARLINSMNCLANA